MPRLAPLLVVSLLSASLGCSADYYARRQAAREQRLALREHRRAQRAAHRQAEALARCADPQHAFDRGHDDGLRRQPMNRAWIRECPAHDQAQRAAASDQGYQQGFDRAAVYAARPGGVVGGHAGGWVCR